MAAEASSASDAAREQGRKRAATEEVPRDPAASAGMKERGEAALAAAHREAEAAKQAIEAVIGALEEIKF